MGLIQMPFKNPEDKKNWAKNYYQKNKSRIIKYYKSKKGKDARKRAGKVYYQKNRMHELQRVALYRQTEIGRKSSRKAALKSAAKRRKLGFNKLIENDWNEPVEWHHINDVDVVPIPKDLHKMCLRGTTEEHREICNELINILYDGELRV